MKNNQEYKIHPRALRDHNIETGSVWDTVARKNLGIFIERASTGRNKFLDHGAQSAFNCSNAEGHALVKVMKAEYEPNERFPVGDLVPIKYIYGQGIEGIEESLGYKRGTFKEGVDIYLYTGPIDSEHLVAQGYSNRVSRAPNEMCEAASPEKGLSGRNDKDSQFVPGLGVPQPGFPNVPQDDTTLKKIGGVRSNGKFVLADRDKYYSIRPKCEIEKGLDL